jgi:hypothetical protein
MPVEAVLVVEIQIRLARLYWIGRCAQKRAWWLPAWSSSGTVDSSSCTSRMEFRHCTVPSVSRSRTVLVSCNGHLDLPLDASVAPFPPRLAPVVRSNGDSHPTQDPIEVKQDSATGLLLSAARAVPRSERDARCQRHELGNDGARPFLELTGLRLG